MFIAKNGHLSLKAGDMDYICFGGGEKVLVMLPGVGDGLKTVKGMALPFALLYRALARDFTVYVFSRRAELPEHMSTREMAADLNEAMEILGLSGTALVGVSQGGMIAQWLAIDHPDKVARLVLTVTLSRPNDTVREAVGRWTEMAAKGDYRGIMLDTAERSYSEKRIRQARLSYRLLGNFGKPKSFARFLTQAESCLTHDAYGDLDRIACPTLVIGGTDDRIVTGHASEEIAARIPGSELFLYEGLGHGLYEEAADFLQRVGAFCRGERKNEMGEMRMKDYRYITLRERTELRERAADWFHSKWGVPREAYLACMDAYLNRETEYGWYLCLDGERIVGGMGVIDNDFHDRKDLRPNVCAVYTEEDCRGQGIAGRLLNLTVEDLRSKGVTPVYLVTDHNGFYERYGWEFYCMAQGDGEDHQTRLYIHR